jgi:hypothetical protein
MRLLNCTPLVSRVKGILAALRKIDRRRALALADTLMYLGLGLIHLRSGDPDSFATGCFYLAMGASRLLG